MEDDWFDFAMKGTGLLLFSGVQAAIATALLCAATDLAPLKCFALVAAFMVANARK